MLNYVLRQNPPVRHSVVWHCLLPRYNHRRYIYLDRERQCVCVCMSEISAAMYGTLSFGKGDRCSSAEFHAVSAAHSRRQRQPACDACKTARVKCRSSANGDKCGRCRGRNRPCTYNARKRQSRHSDVSSDTGEPSALAANRTIEAGTKGANGKPNIGDASPDTPLVDDSVSSSPQEDSPPPPLMQPADYAPWWDGHHDCLFEPFDYMVDSVLTDGESTWHQVRVAESHQELDGPSSSSPADLAAVHHSLPDNYDFSTLCHHLTPPQVSLSKSFLTPISNAAWARVDWQQDEQQPQRQPETDRIQDDKTLHTSALAEFSDLTDMMQFAKGELTNAATPATDHCTCLQDLTASLFSLRSRTEEETQVDGLLVLFRQAMRIWEAVEACPSRCCSLRSFALLLLMNVRELVTLLLDIASALGGGGKDASRSRDSVPAINLGAFTVDDEADQGIIAHIILAARMKELHSFMTRISSKIGLAGLDDICTELNIQIKTLREAFMT